MDKYNFLSYEHFTAMNNALVNITEDAESMEKVYAEGGADSLYEKVIENYTKFEVSNPELYSLVHLFYIMPDIAMRLVTENDKAAKVSKNSYTIPFIVDTILTSRPLPAIVPVVVTPKDEHLEEPPIDVKEAMIRYYNFEWNADKAAAMLGYSRAKFYRLLEKYQLPPRTKMDYKNTPMVMDDVEEIKRKRMVNLTLD